jgi:hypothetical protein
VEWEGESRARTQRKKRAESAKDRLVFRARVPRAYPPPPRWRVARVFVFFRCHDTQATAADRLHRNGGAGGGPGGTGGRGEAPEARQWPLPWPCGCGWPRRALEPPHTSVNESRLRVEGGWAWRARRRHGGTATRWSKRKWVPSGPRPKRPPFPALALVARAATEPVDERRMTVAIGKVRKGGLKE